MLKAKQKKAIERFYEKQIFLAVLPTGYGKSLIYQLICFLTDGLNIFPQAFIATDFPYVTFRCTWQTLQTSLQLLSFWTGFFSLFPTSDGLQILKFIFSRKTTKTGNTITHWRLQILSRKKWRDSDWMILKVRHSTVEWVLHS